MGSIEHYSPSLSPIQGKGLRFVSGLDCGSDFPMGLVSVPWYSWPYSGRVVSIIQRILGLSVSFLASEPCFESESWVSYSVKNPGEGRDREGTKEGAVYPQLLPNQSVSAERVVEVRKRREGRFSFLLSFPISSSLSSNLNGGGRGGSYFPARGEIL